MYMIWPLPIAHSSRNFVWDSFSAHTLEGYLKFAYCRCKNQMTRHFELVHRVKPSVFPIKFTENFAFGYFNFYCDKCFLNIRLPNQNYPCCILERFKDSKSQYVPISLQTLLLEPFNIINLDACIQ